MSRFGFLISVFLLPWSIVQANPIFYEVNNLSGNTWESTYTVTNELPTTIIEEFTIYFELRQYENLLITASPVDWGGLEAQPDPGLPDDGFADWLAFTIGASIDPGETLGGFSVQYDFLGTGSPGSQFFEIVDPFTFDVLSEGFTQPLSLVTVPEPTTLALFGLGLVGLFRRKLLGDQVIGG